MSPDKTKQLFEKYQELYAGRKLPITQNLMAFGFECGDGWFGLLDKLSERIMKVVRWSGKPVKAVQVKEKFGTLRFYIEGGDMETSDIVDALITVAELESGHTCEECGDTLAKLRTGGWIRTLCAKHAVESGYEIEDWEEKSLEKKNKKNGDKPIDSTETRS